MIAVPAGLTGSCGTCQCAGRPHHLVTDGTEIAAVVQYRRFNGHTFVNAQGRSVWLMCPADNAPVEFLLPPA